MTIIHQQDHIQQFYHLTLIILCIRSTEDTVQWMLFIITVVVGIELKWDLAMMAMLLQRDLLAL